MVRFRIVISRRQKIDVAALFCAVLHGGVVSFYDVSFLFS